MHFNIIPPSEVLFPRCSLCMCILGNTFGRSMVWIFALLKNSVDFLSSPTQILRYILLTGYKYLPLFFPNQPSRHLPNQYYIISAFQIVSFGCLRLTEQIFLFSWFRFSDQDFRYISCFNASTMHIAQYILHFFFKHCFCVLMVQKSCIASFFTQFFLFSMFAALSSLFDDFPPVPC